MTARILLFDIDGTLVHAGGAGRRALERAMEDHFGGHVRAREAYLAEMKLDGMTDRLIVREAMASLGVAFDDTTCDRVLETYVRHLEEEIRSPSYRVLPGVSSLLAALDRRGALVGLCTGNVVRGARIKLARGGLDRYFGWGAGDIYGFAADGEARELIVRAALRRASERLGRTVDPRDTLVVGDTPRDIEAAQAAGCRVLAVATGRFGIDELRTCGADVVLPTLDGAHVPDVLLG